MLPYSLKTGRLEVGRHLIELTVYGSWVNTFGSVHNCNQKEIWIGPNAWRSSGTSWSYEYQLKPAGISITAFLASEQICVLLRRHTELFFECTEKSGIIFETEH